MYSLYIAYTFYDHLSTFDKIIIWLTNNI